MELCTEPASLGDSGKVLYMELFQRKTDYSTRKFSYYNYSTRRFIACGMRSTWVYTTLILYDLKLLYTDYSVYTGFSYKPSDTVEPSLSSRSGFYIEPFGLINPV